MLTPNYYNQPNPYQPYARVFFGNENLKKEHHAAIVNLCANILQACNNDSYTYTFSDEDKQALGISELPNELVVYRAIDNYGVKKVSGIGVDFGMLFSPETSIEAFNREINLRTTQDLKEVKTLLELVFKKMENKSGWN